MRTISFLGAVVVLGWAVSARAAPDPSRVAEREALKKALTSVIETSTLKGARVTVQVRSLDDGTIVFSRDGDELLNPASNVKLFTAAAALATLGPDFRFETDFLTDAELKEGKAKVLYVRGRGDPTITTEKLYGLVADLVHAGLKEVSDGIVLDDTYFDGEKVAPGFDQESGDKAYVEPPSDFFVVESELSTGTKTQRRFTVSSAIDKDKVRQKLEVKGVVPFEKGVWSQWKKVDQPALYFGFTLKQMLQARGVKVKGRIRTGAVPSNAKLLAAGFSDTLDIVLKRLNKNSSNFVAEQLIKTIGAEVKGTPGSHVKGVEAVEDFLARDVGVPRGTYVMKNGSGLNDSNRFSASQTNQLLVHMVNRFPIAPEYLSALAIAAKDGTLKYRFEGSDAVGRLRAKTGTLENVSALSGYVQAVGGERFVFSIMVNDFPGRASGVVQHIDALGAAVAAVGSSQGPSAAVASLMKPATVVASPAELDARLKTYVAMGQKGDRRNASFLRTAWRSERDPAVRAVIADALILSDPKEPAHVRIFLDSALASDDVFGRLRDAAKRAQLDTPVLPSLVELAASGQLEAVTRLFEFVRFSAADELASAYLAEQLAVVAHDAPMELLSALRTCPEADRVAALDALVPGLVRQNQADAPLWETLKSAQGSIDPQLASFARSLEVLLSQRIAEAKSPKPVPTVEAPTPPAPTPFPAVQPGG
ncbi:MAG: D-alanyl-D-alanine carboxypeptidase/D-alanyl-D-alanine-endopeptidase [Myxococcaceae bacterium]|nr:D-alanyl-D-alanine carboxypeptidase/D-alanyl-D-alanine-endopeptidase [Myxococcaceae bacterium]